MSTILKFLGSVFLAILLLLGVAAAIYVPKGFALQKSAVAYMETNVPQIVDGWNPEEVMKRAAPEFLTPAVREGMPMAFQSLSALGKLKRLGKPDGGVVVTDFQLVFGEQRVVAKINNSLPKPIWIELVADAEFDAAAAKIKLVLVRRGEDWRILGFWVAPAATAEGR